MRLVCIGVLICADVAVAHPAAAQGRPISFGERPHEPTGGSLVDFTMALSDGYDAGNVQVPAEAAGQVRPDGSYSNLDTALRYTWARRNQQFALEASDSIRYDPQLTSDIAASYEASASYVTPLGRTRRFNVGERFSSTPYFQVELFPTLPVEALEPPHAPSYDYAVSQQTTYTNNGNIGFIQDLSRRTALKFDYRVNSSRFEDRARDLVSQQGSIQLSRRAGRFAAVHVAGAARVARYGGALAVSETHTTELEFGFDWAKRGTAISIASGPALIPVNGQLLYRVNGNASLHTPLGREWNADLHYNRGFTFDAGVPYPFYADSVSAGIDGRPARRLGVRASGGYSTGTVGVSSEGGAYGTYTGSLQLSTPLTRHYAVYGEYLFYHYSFAHGVLADGLPPRLDRHTIRFGLKLWFPVIS